MMRSVSLGAIAVGGAIVMAGCGSSNPMAASVAIPQGAVQLSVPAARAAAFDSALAPFRYFSSVSDRVRLVVRDAVTWEALWSRLSGGSRPTSTLPPVDFTTEMVVFVGTGTRPSGGYSIAIDGAYESGGEVFVAVRVTTPGRSCATTAVITAPAAAVLMPARSGAVKFSETTEVHEC
jgi:hypothetical protein